MRTKHYRAERVAHPKTRVTGRRDALRGSRNRWVAMALVVGWVDRAIKEGR